VLNSKGQWEQLAPQAIPTSFPMTNLVEPRSITFTAKDGQQTYAQIFEPKEKTSRPRPAIMFFHGGPRRQMFLGFHPMGAYNWMYAMNQYLAAKGYLVISVNYRGGIGYGMNYREADNFGPGGGSELNDLFGAVTYLHSRKDVDTQRIGIWGASYGGLMTALGLARASGSIAAGVDYAGVYDWSTFLASVGVPTEPGEATKVAVASSPSATMDQWKSPVLIVQADDDRAVPYQQSTELMQELRTRGVEHEVLMIPNEMHDMTRFSSWVTLFRATDGYFERKLSPQAQ
jgi:dipeptidyl aminopeptidase/acylaminoacyl peptidase